MLDKLYSLAASVEPGVTCRLVASLAAGADQVVVQQALACKHEAAPGGCPWRVEAVIPYDRDVFVREIGDGLPDELARPARDNFHRLLKTIESEARDKDHRIFEVADWSLVERYASQKDNAELLRGLRNNRYEMLGSLLVQQADVLFAIWDGKSAGGPGGTGSVVKLALQQGVPVLRLDPETGELSYIQPRAGTVHPPLMASLVNSAPGLSKRDSDSLVEHFKGRLLVGATEADNAHDQSKYASMDRFLGQSEKDDDQESAGARSVFPRTVYRSFVWAVLKPWSKHAKTEVAARPPIVSAATDASRVEWQATDESQLAYTKAIDASLSEIAIAADAIATARGDSYRSTYIIVFLGAVAAIWAGLAGVLIPQKWAWVSIELGILGILIGVYVWANNTNLHQRWVNARQLAELLRVSRYLAWAGLSGRRTSPAPMAWPGRLTVAALSAPGLPNATLDRPTMAALARTIRDKHVRGQIEYQNRNAIQLAALHHRLDRIGFFALILAIIVGGLYVLGFGFPKLVSSGIYQDWGAFAKGVVTVSGAGLPLLGAALAAIRFQGDFEQFSKRSKITHAALGEIEKRLTDLEKQFNSEPTDEDDGLVRYEDLASVLTDLTDVYLRDLSDWRLIYSSKVTPAPG